MGQRANVVVIEGHRRRLYYDHWCANRIEVEMVWGPAQAIRFAESLRRVEEPQGWLDEVWCEGAAVIDLDARVLLLFGGEDVAYDVPLRRALLRLMRITWAGWEIRWAHEGIASVADHVGLPREPFLTSAWERGGGRFRHNDAFPDDDDVLISRSEGGALTVTRASGLPEDLVSGPACLGDVLERDVRPLAAWTGEFPRGGLHVDADARRLSLWWADDVPAVLERLRPGWASWDVVWLEDRFEQHLALLEGAPGLPEVDPRAQLERAFAHLERLAHSEGKNHARASLESLGGGELNPWTECAAGSVGDVSAKRALLRRLRDEVVG